MYEGILTALRSPLVCDVHQFLSAKTPSPISFTSRRARTVLIQLSLKPTVFVIRPAVREAEAETGTSALHRVNLVTEHGNVAMDLEKSAAACQLYADNCRLAWLCHDYLTDPRDRDRILTALMSGRDLTLTQVARECRFASDPISAVFSLVCADFAEADLESAPIGFRTPISIRRRKGAFA